MMKTIAKLCIYILVIEIFSISPAFSYPTWMELGSYVLEKNSDWSSNIDLWWGVESSTELWQSINLNCTHSLCNWRERFYNEQVTESSLINPVSNPNNKREACDILFIWAHAQPGSIGYVHSGIQPDYGNNLYLSSGNIRFGTGYTRWVYSLGCLTLYPYSTFWTEWRAAFKGLQVYFGNESEGAAIEDQVDAMYYWILKWTDENNPHSFRDAYFDAIGTFIYGFGRCGIKPAILTSTDASGEDYCDKTYAESTSEAGSNPTLKIAVEFGTPFYGPWGN